MTIHNRYLIDALGSSHTLTGVLPEILRVEDVGISAVIPDAFSGCSLSPLRADRLFYVGTRGNERGYAFFGYVEALVSPQSVGGVSYQIWVLAGCRLMRLGDAREHWSPGEQSGRRKESLELVDEIERVGSEMIALLRANDARSEREKKAAALKSDVDAPDPMRVSAREVEVYRTATGSSLHGAQDALKRSKAEQLLDSWEVQHSMDPDLIHLLRYLLERR